MSQSQTRTPRLQTRKRTKHNSMAQLYSGQIERLLIFAAPSGSGKTTFLNAPEERLAENTIPQCLSGFYDMARNHRTVMKMKHASKPVFDNLCIHVDLTNPIRWMKPRPKRRDKLLERIGPKLFDDWKALKTYATRASTLDVVTFFVRREEHFRRWTGRALQQAPGGQLRVIVTTVNGDSTRNSELHRRVYHAWYEFANALHPRSFNVIDGNGETYQFISPSQFKSEIDNGYKI